MFSWTPDAALWTLRYATPCRRDQRADPNSDGSSEHFKDIRGMKFGSVGYGKAQRIDGRVAVMDVPC